MLKKLKVYVACRGYPFPIRGRGGSCGTAPSRAASADAFAPRGESRTATRDASASASPSKLGVHVQRGRRRR
eukprot:3615071-Pleurochrysis_carterae.AAC.1